MELKESPGIGCFSKGSIIETKGWLKRSKTRGLLTEEQFNILFEKLQTIHLKLDAYLKFVGKSKADQ